MHLWLCGSVPGPINCEALCFCWTQWTAVLFYVITPFHLICCVSFYIYVYESNLCDSDIKLSHPSMFHQVFGCPSKSWCKICHLVIGMGNNTELRWDALMAVRISPWAHQLWSTVLLLDTMDSCFILCHNSISPHLLCQFLYICVWVELMWQWY